MARVLPTVRAGQGSRHRARRRPLGVRVRDYGGSFLFLVPYLLFFVAFLLAPLIYAFILSLHNWNTLSGDQGFVGFRHYGYILFTPGSTLFGEFWGGMAHTALFVAVTVPLLVGLSLLLALLVADAPLRGLFRTVLYIPSILSVTVASTIWLFIFQSGGLLDTYLRQDIPWLTTQPWAWLTIIITTLWWTMGFNMIVLLNGVLTVPRDYHEAAMIDGAGAARRVWSITLPTIRPILAFVFITNVLASFGLFAQAQLLTGGGPGDETRPITLYIYNAAFGSDNLATASALSFTLGLILVAVALVQLRLFRAQRA